MNTEITSNLKAQFLRLYQMALTDGDFSPTEWRMLYKFAEDRGVSSKELDNILLGHAGSLTIPESLDERLEYLYDLALMIWADDKLTDDEKESLKKYCRKFEFLDENIDELADFLIEKARMNLSFANVLKEVHNNLS